MGCAQLPKEQATGSSDQVRRVFEAAAFGREGRIGEGTVIRWCEAPALSVPGASTAVEREVRDLARDLTRVTGLPFKAADTGAPSYVVHATANTQVISAVIEEGGLTRADRRKLNRARCFFRLEVAQTGCIARAVIVIPETLEGDERAHCLLEEMTQAMGLVADGEFPFPSLFSERDMVRKRTATDDGALRLLYHPDMAPGLSRRDAAPIIDRILAADF